MAPPLSLLLLLLLLATAQAVPDVPSKSSRGRGAGRIATLTDFKARVVAYRDSSERLCYLERLTAGGGLRQQLRLLTARHLRALPPALERTLYVAPGRLSKAEVWDLAGQRISRFCSGYSAALLLPGPPSAVRNELQPPESPIWEQGTESPVPDFLSQQRQRHTIGRRMKRQASSTAAKPGRKFRGQSQSQFVAFQRGGDGAPGGIAEGTSQYDRSVARVSASNGMGQAQSQSSFDDDCEDCAGGASRRFPVGPDPISSGGFPPIDSSRWPGLVGRPTDAGGGLPGQQQPAGPPSGHHAVPGQTRIPPRGHPDQLGMGHGQGGRHDLDGTTPSGHFPPSRRPGIDQNGVQTPDHSRFGIDGGRGPGQQVPGEQSRIPIDQGGVLTPDHTRFGVDGGRGPGQQVPGGHSRIPIDQGGVLTPDHTRFGVDGGRGPGQQVPGGHSRVPIGQGGVLTPDHTRFGVDGGRGPSQQVPAGQSRFPPDQSGVQTPGHTRYDGDGVRGPSHQVPAGQSRFPPSGYVDQGGGRRPDHLGHQRYDVDGGYQSRIPPGGQPEYDSGGRTPAYPDYGTDGRPLPRPPAGARPPAGYDDQRIFPAPGHPGYDDGRRLVGQLGPPGIRPGIDPHVQPPGYPTYRTPGREAGVDTVTGSRVPGGQGQLSQYPHQGSTLPNQGVIPVGQGNLQPIRTKECPGGLYTVCLGNVSQPPQHHTPDYGRPSSPHGTAIQSRYPGYDVNGSPGYGEERFRPAQQIPQAQGPSYPGYGEDGRLIPGQQVPPDQSRIPPGGRPYYDQRVHTPGYPGYGEDGRLIPGQHVPPDQSRIPPGGRPHYDQRVHTPGYPGHGEDGRLIPGQQVPPDRSRISPGGWTLYDQRVHTPGYPDNGRDGRLGPGQQAPPDQSRIPPGGQPHHDPRVHAPGYPGYGEDGRLIPGQQVPPDQSRIPPGGWPHHDHRVHTPGYPGYGKDGQLIPGQQVPPDQSRLPPGGRPHYDQGVHTPGYPGYGEDGRLIPGQQLPPGQYRIPPGGLPNYDHRVHTPGYPGYGEDGRLIPGQHVPPDQSRIPPGGGPHYDQRVHTPGYPGYGEDGRLIPGQQVPPEQSRIPPRGRPGYDGYDQTRGQTPGYPVPAENDLGPGSQFPRSDTHGLSSGQGINSSLTPSREHDGRIAHEGDGRSQVKTSVYQENNETLASSSAQGLYGEGRAQTQVSGSYKGTGSFSAQAQTSDRNRGAQSQVLGSSDGATSAGQAHGGSGQSQAEVKLASETGLTIAGSQTSSANFGSQAEVQAGEMGGTADAQARGQGNTQSQAQVGFKPYQSSRDNDDQRVPFRGGGSASAQTGSYTGSSQSQVQGAFRYGISYSGAAQASSGSKDQLAREGIQPLEPLRQFSYSQNRTGLPSPTSSSSSDSVTVAGRTESRAPANQGHGLRGVGNTEAGHRSVPSSLQDESPTMSNQNARSTTEQPLTQRRSSTSSTHSLHHGDSFRTSHGVSQDASLDDIPPQLTPVDVLPTNGATHSTPLHLSSSRQGVTQQTRSTGSSAGSSPGTSRGSAGGGQSYQTTRLQSGQQTNRDGSSLPTQSQTVVLGNIDNLGVHVIQDADGTGLSKGTVLQPGHEVHGKPGYVIPGGFRGRVVSTSGDHARATSDPGGQAQTQTVIVTPGQGNVTYTGPSGFTGEYEDSEEDESEEDEDYSVPPEEYSPPRTRAYQPAQRFSQHELSRGQPNHRGGTQTGGYVRNGAGTSRGIGGARANPDTYVSVTKSVTGKLDGKGSNPADGNKYAHTYYTKSSTCGYFTFSCNIVYGSNGRTKICKPKGQTNPDGSPCLG